MREIQVDNSHGMNIEWVVSNVCNYSCSYCNEDLYGGSSGQPDYKKALKFFDYLHNNVSSGKKLLNLTGGEPTVWPKLIPFLQGLDDSYLTQLTTNGSRTVRWWKRLLDNYQNLARVAISTHLEFADINHILEVSKLLHDKTELTILMLADQKNFYLVRKYAPMFKELDCTVFIKPIRGRDGLAQEYTQEQKDYIKNFKKTKNNGKHLGVPTHLVVDGEPKSFKYTMEMLSQNLHAFRGWKCDIGKTRLIIWHDGTVTGAQCGTAKKIPLGNMYDGKITLPTGPVTCQTDFCMCLSDIRIPKWQEDV